jgi:hypothetical protein
MATAFLRMRDAFAPYSGLLTLAGIAMVVVFGTKYIQHRGALDEASPDTASPATVTAVQEVTCIKSAHTRLQTFNVKQRCLDVQLQVSTPQGGAAAQRVFVEQSTVGTLAAGDAVYVLPSISGINGYLIINAHDRLGFFLRQYAAAGMALLGLLMIGGSFFIKRAGGEEE